MGILPTLMIKSSLSSFFFFLLLFFSLLASLPFSSFSVFLLLLVFVLPSLPFSVTSYMYVGTWIMYTTWHVTWYTVHTYVRTILKYHIMRYSQRRNSCRIFSLYLTYYSNASLFHNLISKSLILIEGVLACFII